MPRFHFYCIPGPECTGLVSTCRARWAGRCFFCVLFLWISSIFCCCCIKLCTLISCCTCWNIIHKILSCLITYLEFVINVVIHEHLKHKTENQNTATEGGFVFCLTGLLYSRFSVTCFGSLSLFIAFPCSLPCSLSLHPSDWPAMFLLPVFSTHARWLGRQCCCCSCSVSGMRSICSKGLISVARLDFHLGFLCCLYLKHPHLFQICYTPILLLIAKLPRSEPIWFKKEEEIM